MTEQELEEYLRQMEQEAGDDTEADCHRVGDSVVRSGVCVLI